MLETLGIGASLREERVRRGLTLDAVETDTRIRGRYLEAIEDERWDELPAEAYAKGFLRTYASYLELDPQQFLAAFRRARREVEEPIAPLPQPPYEASGRRVAALGAGLAVVAIVLAVGAWRLTGGEPAAATGPTTVVGAPPASAAGASSTGGTQRSRPAPGAPLVLAARADTWLDVRLHGPRGRRVWSGTLKQGRRLRLGVGRELWLRAGRPDALRARLGTRRVRVPASSTFTATRAGLRPA